MIRAGKRVFLVMIGVSLAASGVGAEAEGGWLIRNPYGGHTHCTRCVAASSSETYKKPEPTTAILRLWIPEHVTWAEIEVVRVNGQPLKRQQLAGVHKQWLTCELAGLTARQSVIRTVTVNCAYTSGQKPTNFAIVAGEVKELYLTPGGFTE